MKITAEVAGKTADRFRAYGAAKMTRKPRLEDHTARAVAEKRAFTKNQRIRYDVEQVVAEGKVNGSGILTVSAEDGAVITRVVFYGGPVESEVVVGSVEVGEAGPVDIELVEPAAVDKIEVLDE